MSALSTVIVLPIELPPNWVVEDIPAYGHVIQARDATGAVHGFVTVDEWRRGFALGMTPVQGRSQRIGRGWKLKLYQDAIEALQQSIVSSSPAQPVAEAMNKTRSQRMREAGFGRPDRALVCEDCGGKFSVQFLPVHKCAGRDESRS